MAEIAVSFPAFFVTFIILIWFTMIVFTKKWFSLTGKIFTSHLFVKTIWFFGIFLTGLNSFELVQLGGVLFLIGGWGLGYTMLLFATTIIYGDNFFKKFFKWSLIASVIFFITFFFVKPFELIPEDGGYYFKLTNYFLLPALVLSTSYYLTIFIFFYYSRKAPKGNYFMLFAIGLLTHAMPAHALVILEFFFGFRNLILNMEYFSLFGFALALFAYFKGIEKNAIKK